ncbi:hypothetical protein CPB86DRAFT_816988 [Serendipita vermifera]|nr:hypothetical protein CPB86DRAFT_816988 [Serendipita vermifera]
MSTEQRNSQLLALDEAPVLANMAKDTLAVALVPSPIKDAMKVLVTVLETMREVKSNKEAWYQLGTTLSNQIHTVQMNLNQFSPPHSTALVLMANRYEISSCLLEKTIRPPLIPSYRQGRDSAAHVRHGFLLERAHEMSIMAHEAGNRTEGGINDLLYNNYIQDLETIKDSRWDIHRTCLPGTRTQVLNAINIWVNDPTSNQVLWLTDVAGSGKSTIARHLAEQWKESGLLGGCFLFNKNVVDATKLRLFCSTSAAQLAHHPLYQFQLRPSIIIGIKELGTMSSFKENLMRLVIEPSRELELVLIIDALEECNENDRLTLLDCLLSSISQSRRLKILMTSRPELDIDQHLHPYRSHTASLHHAGLESNQADIEMFVQGQLSHLVSNSITHSNKFELLCKRVNCLFILASTPCRAIRNHPDPPAMLGVLLEATRISLVGINKVYSKILENACRLEEVDECVWTVIQNKTMQVLKAIVSAAIPLSISCLDAILGTEGTERVVRSLGSVVSVAEDKTVHLLHPTFREFLVDNKAAKQFYIDLEEAHALMATYGYRIVSDSTDTIKLWDTKTGQAVGDPLYGHTGSVNSVAFSPDGRQIVSGSHDKTVRIWDAETGQTIGKSLEGHATVVSSVAFSPKGHQIVSGSWDCTTRLWDAEHGQAIREPFQLGHTNLVKSVAFSQDRRLIVSGSMDHTVRVWDVETGQPLGRPLRGHTQSVTSVSFSPDRLWDTKTGQEINGLL